MRIDHLTFTRFIAAMAIVVFHFGKNRYPFDSDKIAFLFEYADIGVSYFFILSGFIMIVAYGKQVKVGIKSYLQNRFARIFPVYLFALLLTVGIKLLYDEHICMTDLTLNVSMLQSWFPGKALTLNFPGWSLSVEMLFYVMFPVVFNHFYTKQKKLPFIPILAFWIISQITLHLFYTSALFEKPLLTNVEFINYFPITHINQFLLGNLAGLLFLKYQHWQGNHDLKIVALLCILVLLLKFKLPWLHYHNGLLGVVFAPFIVLLSLNTGVITRLLSNRYAIFLGEASFGIYILQVPVFALVFHYLIKVLGLPIYSNQLFYLSVIILIVTSALTFLFIEKPLRNVLKSR